LGEYDLVAGVGPGALADGVLGADAELVGGGRLEVLQQNPAARRGHVAQLGDPRVEGGGDGVCGGEARLCPFTTSVTIRKKQLDTSTQTSTQKSNAN